jgi:hypothetical protein
VRRNPYRQVSILPGVRRRRDSLVPSGQSVRKLVRDSCPWWRHASPNRISSSGHGHPDRFKLDLPTSLTPGGVHIWGDLQALELNRLERRPGRRAGPAVGPIVGVVVGSMPPYFFRRMTIDANTRRDEMAVAMAHMADGMVKTANDRADEWP